MPCTPYFCKYRYKKHLVLVHTMNIKERERKQCSVILKSMKYKADLYHGIYIVWFLFFVSSGEKGINVVYCLWKAIVEYNSVYLLSAHSIRFDAHGASISGFAFISTNLFFFKAAFSLQASENNLKPSLNQFKRQIKVQQSMATRGSYVHNPVVKLSGASQNVSFMQFSQNIDGFRQSNSQGF